MRLTIKYLEAHSTSMAERKPDMQIATVPGHNHCPFLDESESLKAVNAFLVAYRSRVLTGWHPRVTTAITTEES